MRKHAQPHSAYSRRGVDDLNASSSGRVDIDLIVTDSMPSDDFEFVPLIEQCGIHHTAGADDETVGTHDLTLERGRVERSWPCAARLPPQDAPARWRACSSATG